MFPETRSFFFFVNGVILTEFPSTMTSTLTLSRSLRTVPSLPLTTTVRPSIEAATPSGISTEYSIDFSVDEAK